MTDSEKLEALKELLFIVIHSLEMTEYYIEDPSVATKVVSQADDYHQQMMNILYPHD